MSQKPLPLRFMRRSAFKLHDLKSLVTKHPFSGINQQIFEAFIIHLSLQCGCLAGTLSLTQKCFEVFCKGPHPNIT